MPAMLAGRVPPCDIIDRSEELKKVVTTVFPLTKNPPTEDEDVVRGVSLTLSRKR